MPSWHRAFAVAAIAAATFISPTPPASAQETLEFSIAEARGLGREAYRAGDYALASAIARALLERKPDDTAALLLLAASEPKLGRANVGRRAGARAWASTESRGLRHEAAHFTYKAALVEERYTAAQFWLRRAWQTAETEERREKIGKDFRRLRAASPWIARFSFDVAPSTNLNGGATSEFLVIDDSYPVGRLSGTARALSGTTASTQGQLSYTLSKSPEQRTALTFNGYRNFNRLSEEARDLAPDAKGSDFDYGVAELVFSHHRRKTAFFLPDELRLAVGQTWYGLEPLDKVTRLTVAKSFDLTPRDRLRFMVQGEHRDPDTPGRQDRQGRELRLDYLREFSGGHLLNLRLSARNVTSDEENQAYDYAAIRLRAAMGEDLEGFRLSGHIERAFKNYPDYSIGFIDIEEGREDRETAAALNLHVDRVGYMGFTPVISLQGRWTESNISRFEAETLGLSVGFRSAF